MLKLLDLNFYPCRRWDFESAGSLQRSKTIKQRMSCVSHKTASDVEAPLLGICEVWSTSSFPGPTGISKAHLAFEPGEWFKVNHLVPDGFSPGSNCFAGLSLLLGTWSDPKGKCQGDQRFFFGMASCVSRFERRATYITIIWSRVESDLMRSRENSYS